MFVVLDIERSAKERADAIEAIKKIPGVMAAAPVERVVDDLVDAGWPARKEARQSTKRKSRC